MITKATNDVSKERPGHLGAGRKPRRARSIQEFSEGFDAAAWAHSEHLLADRNRRARKQEEERLNCMFELRKAETEAAYKACLPGANPTDEQRALVRKADDAAFFLKRHLERSANRPEAVERIQHGYGF